MLVKNTHPFILFKRAQNLINPILLSTALCLLKVSLKAKSSRQSLTSDLTFYLLVAFVYNKRLKIVIDHGASLSVPIALFFSLALLTDVWLTQDSGCLLWNSSDVSSHGTFISGTTISSVHSSEVSLSKMKNNTNLQWISSKYAVWNIR